MPRKVDAPGLAADYIMEGTHVYDPPEGRVLMDDPRCGVYERLYGFYSEGLIQSHIDSSARVGGVGGGGLALTVMLAKHGVRDLSIADPEQIEESNVGRIPFLTYDHVGRNKAEVAAELITAHNPMARVRVYEDGITGDNVDEFLGFNAGNPGKTFAFDEIELKKPEVACLFHRTARKYGRFVISATDVDRGGMVTVFDPTDLDHTYEHYTGGKPTDSTKKYMRKVKGFQLPTIANVPRKGSIKTLIATQTGAALPTTSRAVLIATDAGLDEYEKLLTLGDKRYEPPHIYPRIHCINPSQGEDFETKHPRTRSVGRILHAVARDAIGLNPPVSYSKSEREAREAYRAQIANTAQ